MFESLPLSRLNAHPEQEQGLVIEKTRADDDLDPPKTCQNYDEAVVSSTQGPTDPRKPRECVQKLPSVLLSTGLPQPSAYAVPPLISIPTAPQPPEPPAIKRKVGIIDFTVKLFLLLGGFS